MLGFDISLPINNQRNADAIRQHAQSIARTLAMALVMVKQNAQPIAQLISFQVCSTEAIGWCL
jgi:hypothetical protein